MSNPYRSKSTIHLVLYDCRDISTVEEFDHSLISELTDPGVLGTGLTFEGPMDALEGFRITGSYEMDTALRKFIDLIRDSKLTVHSSRGFHM